MAPWLDCRHMRLVVVSEAGPLFIHSVSPRVTQEPLLRFRDRLDWVAGFKFLRVRSDVGNAVASNLRDLAQTAPAREAATVDRQVEDYRTARGQEAKGW